MELSTTDRLTDVLKITKIDEISSFISDNCDKMIQKDNAFRFYVLDRLAEKRRTQTAAFIAAGISEPYGRKLVSGEKHTINRDIIIRICIGGRFTLDETQKAIKLYGMNPLYVRDHRDAVIMAAIHGRKYELSEIDDLLEQEGCSRLSADKEE